jgi:hypothetical protein
VTFVYAARDQVHNGAVALKAFLDRRLKETPGAATRKRGP